VQGSSSCHSKIILYKHQEHHQLSHPQANNSTGVSFGLPTPPLAPSPRIAAYLARKGLSFQGTMALVAAESGVTALPDSEKLPPPPKVATTPCDPWPRPYYLEGGLRRVHPYHFTYNTNAKQRWRGREILDVFSSEFRVNDNEYYVCPSHPWPYGSITRTNFDNTGPAEEGH
jgi:hypothetical protein